MDAEQFADRVMVLVDEDIAAGRVPADVASFVALHDHVDANEYVIDVLAGHFVRGDESAEVMFGDAETAMANAVMDIVAARLAERTGAPQPCGIAGCDCHLFAGEPEGQPEHGPEWWMRAQAGTCSHGGHDDPFGLGVTCSDGPGGE